jgi:hypothetical protein
LLVGLERELERESAWVPVLVSVLVPVPVPELVLVPGLVQEQAPVLGLAQHRLLPRCLK